MIWNLEKCDYTSTRIPSFRNVSFGQLILLLYSVFLKIQLNLKTPACGCVQRRKDFISASAEVRREKLPPPPRGAGPQGDRRLQGGVLATGQALRD